jgi:hypothetical protein
MLSSASAAAAAVLLARQGLRMVLAAAAVHTARHSMSPRLTAARYRSALAELARKTQQAARVAILGSTGPTLLHQVAAQKAARVALWVLLLLAAMVALLRPVSVPPRHLAAKAALLSRQTLQAGEAALVVRLAAVRLAAKAGPAVQSMAAAAVPMAGLVAVLLLAVL